jgi:isopropylmalate/homocitrate/citramalate synthase
MSEVNGPRVEMYDTTLRDGSQQVGLDLTVEDKLRVATALDALGVDVVEGSWQPSARPGGPTGQRTAMVISQSCLTPARRS